MFLPFSAALLCVSGIFIDGCLRILGLPPCVEVDTCLPDADARVFWAYTSHPFAGPHLIQPNDTLTRNLYNGRRTLSPVTPRSNNSQTFSTAENS